MTTIKVALHEGNQADIRINDLENYITTPNQWLLLQQVDKSGVPISSPVALKKDDENYFVAEIPLTLNWAQGEGWWYPGKLSLQFTALPNNVRDDRLFNGVWLPPGLEDKRINGDEMTVGVIEIRLSWWIYLLFIALILCILIMGLVFIQLFVYPTYWIRSHDAGRKVELLIYDSIEGPDDTNAYKFPIAGQRKINLDHKIRIVTEDGQSKVASQFRVKRKLTEPPSVTINYRWNDRRLYKTTVAGKVTKFLGGITGNYVIQLEYTKSH
jgi:hypothetical protein